MELEELSKLIDTLGDTLKNISNEMEKCNNNISSDINSLSEYNINHMEKSYNPHYYSIPTATSYSTESFRSFIPDESQSITQVKLSSEIFKTNSDSKLSATNF